MSEGEERRPASHPAPAETEPEAEEMRAVCPRCGETLVSGCYYLADQGYVVVWECPGARQRPARCDYRRTL